jgi:hypothetical protein
VTSSLGSRSGRVASSSVRPTPARVRPRLCKPLRPISSSR